MKKRIVLKMLTLYYLIYISYKLYYKVKKNEFNLLLLVNF